MAWPGVRALNVFHFGQMYPRTQVSTYLCTFVPDTALAQRAVWAASPPCFPGQFLFLGSFLSYGFDRDAAAPAVQMIEVPQALVPNLLTGIFPVSRLFPVFRENDGQSWNELKRSLCLSRNIFDQAALPQTVFIVTYLFLLIIRSTTTFLKHQSYCFTPLNCNSPKRQQSLTHTRLCYSTNRSSPANSLASHTRKNKSKSNSPPPKPTTTIIFEMAAFSTMASLQQRPSNLPPCPGPPPSRPLPPLPKSG